MGDVQQSWPLHHVRAWGRHGIHFGLTGRTPASLLITPFWMTALCELDDLRPRAAHPPEPLPENLRLIVALEHDVTCYRFSHRHADRERRGQLSARFLDAGAFREEITPMLAALGPRLQALLLRFPAIYPTERLSAPEFIRRLGTFLEGLPSGHRYAIELHTPRFLLPEYLECLRARGVAHALCTLPGGPPLLEQVLRPGVLTSSFSLLRLGTEGGPAAVEDTLGAIELIRSCVDSRVALHVHLESRTETERHDMRFLSAMMEMLNQDLSRLSPIRRRAA